MIELKYGYGRTNLYSWILLNFCNYSIAIANEELQKATKNNLSSVQIIASKALQQESDIHYEIMRV